MIALLLSVMSFASLNLLEAEVGAGTGYVEKLMVAVEKKFREPKSEHPMFRVTDCPVFRFPSFRVELFTLDQVSLLSASDNPKLGSSDNRNIGQSDFGLRKLFDTAAGTSHQDELLDRIYQSSAAINNFHAQFSQQKKTRSFGRPLKSHGSLIVLRHDQGSFFYLENYRRLKKQDTDLLDHVISITPETMTTYYPPADLSDPEELPRAEVVDFKEQPGVAEALNVIIFLFGQSQEAWEKAYDIRLDPQATGPRLYLRPKDAQVREEIQDLVLELDADTLWPQTLSWSQRGDRIMMNFSEVKVNQDDVTPGDLALTLPDGTLIEEIEAVDVDEYDEEASAEGGEESSS